MSEENRLRDFARTTRSEDWESPHPLYCIWEITLKCDLGCKHCGSRAGKTRAHELTTEQCFDVIHQLASLGLREIVLIGGEAYLREDWPELAKEIVRCGMVCGMTTGARNLTKERVEQAVEAGLQSISVSIDGLEQTHDAIRGAKGSWQAARRAASYIAESPIQLSVNTQINRLSMHELPAIADLLVEWDVKAWQTQLTVAIGRAADRPEMLLQPYELLELFPMLASIKQETLLPNGIELLPANNIGYFGPYERILRAGGEHGVHWQGCSAGLWVLGIEADGTVKGCPSLPTQSYAGGNILDLSLEDIVANTPELRKLRERTVEDLWGYCKTCYYADTCKAGCAWTSHSLLGRPGNNPYCIHRAMDLEKQGIQERVVKVENASGLPFDHGRFEIVREPFASHSSSSLEVNSLRQDLMPSETKWSQDELNRILKKINANTSEPIKISP